jgi:tryptophan synthase alpha chain
MNRVNQVFEDLRARGQKALMPFLTAGDPDLNATAALLPAIERAGASVCELGIPFSDPVADGPVIQASMAHALAGGVTPGRVLETIARVRPRLKMGLIAMVSFSIVHRLGVGSFLRDAGAAGLDGLIVPDIPLEEVSRSRLGEQAEEHGLICSLLIAPTTPLERAERIAKASSGFVYLLARSGITGERGSLPADLGERVTGLRKVTDLPIAVGFGISTPEQVKLVGRVADAVIVGSALMRRVAAHRSEGGGAVVAEVELFLSEMSAALRVTDDGDDALKPKGEAPRYIRTKQGYGRIDPGKGSSELKGN